MIEYHLKKMQHFFYLLGLLLYLLHYAVNTTRVSLND